MKALAAALVEFQKNAPHIAKDSVNPHFKNRYASLDAIMDAVRGPLAEQGLVITQHPSEHDLVPTLDTILLHVSGEMIRSTMLLSAERSGPQAQGSALTYARRYAVLAVLGLVADEDDDGEAATRGKEAAKPKTVGSEDSSMASEGDGLSDPTGIKGAISREEGELTVAILVAAGKLGAEDATREAVGKSKATRTPDEHIAWLKRNLKTAQALQETTEAAGV